MKKLCKMETLKKEIRTGKNIGFIKSFRERKIKRFRKSETIERKSRKEQFPEHWKYGK